MIERESRETREARKVAELKGFLTRLCRGGNPYLEAESLTSVLAGYSWEVLHSEDGIRLQITNLMSIRISQQEDSSPQIIFEAGGFRYQTGNCIHSVDFEQQPGSAVFRVDCGLPVVLGADEEIGALRFSVREPISE